MVRAEFDVRDGTVLNVPASTISVSVLNRNEPGDSDVTVSAFFAEGAAPGLNTRSFDIDDDQPNIRVPSFATRVVYQLAVPDANYRALVSDSESGETYGQIPEGVVYTLHHRARWIRFFDVQTQAGGVITFFLSI